MRPNDLAAELGISPKTLRAGLREKYEGTEQRPPVAKHSPWILNPAQIEWARGRWG